MGLALQKINDEHLPKPVRTADFVGDAVVLARQTVDPVKHLSSQRRAIMNERALFCREVFSLIQRGNTTKEAAVAVSLHPELFPELLKAGKKLNDHNYRKWMQKIGKHKNGRPNWDNLTALADRYCTTVHERAGDPRFWELFNTVYLNQNQFSFARAHEKTKILARGCGILDNDFPTVGQVIDWYKKNMEPTMVALARFGEEHVRNNYLDYIRRDWSGVSANYVWFGDHHVFDAPCKEWDQEKGKWKAVRPWITAWVDATSFYFTGWVIRTCAPDSLSIMDSFLCGGRLNNNQFPAFIYTDNGKDYLIKGFSTPYEVDGHEHAICTEIGTKTIRAIPDNARAKTIERIFGEVCSGFSKEFPSYLGNSPGARPEVAGFFWNNPEHLPTLQEYCELFAMWLQDEYHARPNHGKILHGQTPAEAWSKRKQYTPEISDEQLWQRFLFPAATPVVGRGAVIRFNKRDWQCEGLWPFVKTKQRVLVKIDRFNSRLFACHLDGRMIGECRPVGSVPAIAQTDADRKLIGEKQADQRRQLKRAYTLGMEATGGKLGLSVVDLKQLPDPTKPLVVESPGSRRSVKGASHQYRLLTANQGGVTTGFNQPPQATPDTSPDAVPTRPDQPTDTAQTPTSGVAPFDVDPDLVAELYALRNQDGCDTQATEDDTSVEEQDLDLLAAIQANERREQDGTDEDNWQRAWY